VPLNTHPLAARARAAGVPIIGDIELFAQARAELPPHKVVGITGTNGKSTTTALVHHILQTAGVPSLMGGNIGLPILAQQALPEGGVYVLELSSYQLDLTHALDCEVAVLLNITPDHLDRYDGFEAYAASKARLFEMQTKQHLAVVDESDALPKLGDFFVRLKAVGPGPKVWLVDGEVNGQNEWPALQGWHNRRNSACAIATCRTMGVEEDVIRAALRTFPGLPHRTERVGERDGVAYVNDSKATNPDSAAPALAAFARVHWILGGRAKAADLDACRPHVKHVARAYTIGEAGPVFAELLRRESVPVEEAGTLACAVASAARQARAGDTVLLSPAAASFDQFSDYEARGDVFRALVEGLR